MVDYVEIENNCPEMEIACPKCGAMNYEKKLPDGTRIFLEGCQFCQTNPLELGKSFIEFRYLCGCSFRIPVTNSGIYVKKSKELKSCPYHRMKRVYVKQYWEESTK